MNVMNKIYLFILVVCTQSLMLSACGRTLMDCSSRRISVQPVADFMLVISEKNGMIFATFRLRNEYGEPIQVLKTSVGIMDMPYPEQFKIHCSTGRPKYLGPLRSTNISDAEPLILVPTEGVTVTFNLSDYYDFSECEGMIYGKYTGLVVLAGKNFDDSFIFDSDTAYFVFSKRQEHENSESPSAVEGQ